MEITLPANSFNSADCGDAINIAFTTMLLILSVLVWYWFVLDRELEMRGLKGVCYL